MKASVVSISRTTGSYGEDIGRIVARELRFGYADEEVIDRAAEMAGVSHRQVEESESSPSQTERFGSALRTLIRGLGAASAPVDRRAIDESNIVTAIFQLAEEGQVVIVAHGSSIPLAHRQDVLRVLITASPEIRSRRLEVQEGMSAQDARNAIDHSDGERRNFFRRFYNVEEELNTHYDLVINTDHLSAEEAANLIIFAASE